AIMRWRAAGYKAAGSVAGRRDAEFQHVFALAVVLDEAADIVPVDRADTHPVLEHFPAVIEPVAHIGDGEAAIGDELAHLGLGRRLALGEAQYMQGVVLTRHPLLDPAEEGERADGRERGQHRR